MTVRHRGRGEAILEYLVKHSDGARPVDEIALGVGARDGRSVAMPIRELERAGLVQRTSGKRALWYPTARGREVDRLLDEVTFARGGTFRPLKDVGIVFLESYALRK